MENAFESGQPRPETANEQQEKAAEKKEHDRPIAEITTARGSKYRYLPDGRTQREKVATDEILEPQDMLIFIPPWETVHAQAQKLYPHIFDGIENQIQYEQLMLTYVQVDGFTVRVIDEKSNELATNAEVAETDKAFIAFIDKNNAKNSFTLPVAKKPQLGYQTFDSRKFTDKDGNSQRERHLGNTITEITYADGE